MSLISQNVAVVSSIEKVMEENTLSPSSPPRNADASDVDKSGLDTSRAKKRKKEHKIEDKQLVKEQKEMMKLENFLFGSLYSPVEFGKDEEQNGFNSEEKTPALYIMDRSADHSLSAYEDDYGLLDESTNKEEHQQRKPVWVDEEEEKATVNITNVSRLRKLRKEEHENSISGSEYVSRLRAQHAKINPGTEWAQLDAQSRGDDDLSSDDENAVALAGGYDNVDSIDDILRTSEKLVVKSGGKLMPGLLGYSRLVDANAEEPSNGPINSVQFHRNSQLLLATGLDRKLRFFQIDGKRNTKIQSIFLEDCPIRKASFLPDGSQVIIAGRRKFFYSLDLVKAKVDKIGPLVGREEKSLEAFEISPDSSTIAFMGNEGYILLVSTKTKELIGTLKMNGTVRSLAFADDGRQLLSSGGDGQIYHWDLRTRTCIHKAVDEGCINGTALCTSPNGLFAAGSNSGIVNIYNRQEFLGGKKKPLKAIENLTTKVDFLKFNHDAQILAICSRMKQSSLKLIHIPSFTIFSNWPPPKKNLQYPSCLDFSPEGGYMAVGNAAGKVLLYKLHHYHHA
ncbi:U3 small nucleolar RNA-associated protein 18 homolog [Cucumis sativus]|uniref:U3 small nucleolar RNA-associated protein 18 homolog n=1 Tax=Cucumis sativus TaxID=3659 RepID=A0A0A0LMJ5_CUCSA|nr:U3 small nucleolar RNA-associated protein 18 homolog [Cucumis sativus]XP_031737145.1 U3 small nucleolar RNA-associated protein 18 homolog [Cucumis sativus]KGN61987.1 hypothetical protein Csa_006014 [Cucumis sativus]